ncbi:histidine kinase [Flavobacterium jejuense]|uniref:Histidine kinase n=1 Tax=Flavobacterium jejuense TaxID=1544455 RepID=A0ABX0ITD0_9FLAO|nr:histidine kinase [Flavobacterium jejuense]NHN26380.1 histidine kinase [Flavobacterium jejuense]
MKLIDNYKYHIFNLIGWILYVFATLTFQKVSYCIFVLDKWTVIQTNSFYYSILEGVLCGILGFILSYIILYFFEKLIDFSKIETKKVVLLIVVFLLVQVIYHLLLWPMVDIPSMYYFGKSNATVLTFLMKLANVPFFFVAFLVWFFVVSSIKVYHYLNLVKITRLELESTLKESKLNALKGQINPHFMFNSLNNIRGLILENPEKSREMITRLSEMLRYSLTKNNVNAISIEEEIEVVDNFIAISKIQLEDRLEFVKEIQPEIMQRQIPPMVIQLLVENAVKHGIANRKHGGIVKLEIGVVNESLVIEVSNSGKLVIDANSTQLGIQNIKERIGLLYGKEAAFSLQETDDTVKAIIKLPIV